MEKNKLIFILLFLVGVMFGQTTTKVGGVSFSYDNKTDTMKLLVPDSVMTSENSNWQKEIRILKEYKQIINNQEVIGDTFYYACGRNYNTGSEFTYYFPECDKCVYQVTSTNLFILKYPPKGNYIITVSDVYDEKWRTNSKTGFIIIN